MLQLLQNHSVSHYTDSQHSLILSFLWIQVICGNIVIIGFQRSHSGQNFGNIFYFFVPGAQSNKDN